MLVWSPGGRGGPDRLSAVLGGMLDREMRLSWRIAG